MVPTRRKRDAPLLDSGSGSKETAYSNASKFLRLQRTKAAMEARYKRRLGSWAGALALNREFGFQGAKEVVDLAPSRREPDAQGPKGTLEENLGREPWGGAAPSSPAAQPRSPRLWLPVIPVSARAPRFFFLFFFAGRVPTSSAPSAVPRPVPASVVTWPALCRLGPGSVSLAPRLATSASSTS